MGRKRDYPELKAWSSAAAIRRSRLPLKPRPLRRRRKPPRPWRERPKLRLRLPRLLRQLRLEVQRRQEPPRPRGRLNQPRRQLQRRSLSLKRSPRRLRRLEPPSSNSSRVRRQIQALPASNPALLSSPGGPEASSPSRKCTTRRRTSSSVS